MLKECVTRCQYLINLGGSQKKNGETTNRYASKQKSMGDLMGQRKRGRHVGEKRVCY
jgi:hypothetical protein